MKAPVNYGTVLLGLDVALRNTGVFVWNRLHRRVAHVEVISTVAEEESYVIDGHVANVRLLTERLDRVISFYRPDYVFAELPHGGAKSSRAAVMMSLAVGAVAATCRLRNLRMAKIGPNQTKRLIRAKGAVDKDEVRQFLIDKHGYEFASSIRPESAQEHVYDAAGAIWSICPLL